MDLRRPRVCRRSNVGLVIQLAQIRYKLDEITQEKQRNQKKQDNAMEDIKKHDDILKQLNMKDGEWMLIFILILKRHSSVPASHIFGRKDDMKLNESWKHWFLRAMLRVRGGQTDVGRIRKFPFSSSTITACVTSFEP